MTVAALARIRSRNSEPLASVKLMPDAIRQRVAPTGAAVPMHFAVGPPIRHYLNGLEGLHVRSCQRLGGVFDRRPSRCPVRGRCRHCPARSARGVAGADVSLPVARDFIKAVQDKRRSGRHQTITPVNGVKIVRDELIRVLTGDGEPDALKIDNALDHLMVGLQGSGKTPPLPTAKRLRQTGQRVLPLSLTPTAPPRWNSCKSSRPKWDNAFHRQGQLRCR